MMELSTVEQNESRVERDILYQMRKGDRSRLGELIDRYGEDLMHYLAALLGNRENAEDVFQETWVKVMERIHRYNPDKPFPPWLFRVARNGAYDQLRRNKRSRPQPLDANTGEVTSNGGLDSTLAANDLTAKLLARLSSKHRELIHMRFYEDQSYQQIAERCRIPIGTVKSGLRRALDNVARLYEKLEPKHNAGS